jgi:hypothetical protein
MSWLTRFDEQWNTFVNVVESRVRQEIESQNHIETETVNRLLQEEVRRSWSSSTHLNGSWLSNLKHDHPELGKALQDGLTNLRVKQSYALTAQSPRGPLLTGLGLTGATYVATRALSLPPSAQLTTAAFVGISGGIIAKTIWNNQKQGTLDETIRHLRLELEAIAKPLRALTKQADSLNENSTSR